VQKGAAATQEELVERGEVDLDRHGGWPCLMHTPTSGTGSSTGTFSSFPAFRRC